MPSNDWKPATCRIPRASWDILFTSFAEGCSLRQAAKRAGVDTKTARRARDVGWMSPEWASRAIADILDEQRNEIRANYVDEDAKKAEHARRLREERDKAETDKLEQELRELRAIRGALSNGSAILGIASRLGQALVPTVDKIAQILKDKPLEDVQALTEVLLKVSRIGERATRMVNAAIEMERRRVGKPNQIIEVQSAPPAFNSSKAVELLGTEEAVKAALKDLVDGNMTREAKIILEACRVPGPEDAQ